MVSNESRNEQKNLQQFEEYNIYDVTLWSQVSKVSS